MIPQSRNIECKDSDKTFVLFPDEKAVDIIANVRTATDQQKAIGKFRTEIKNMPEDYRVKVLRNLRCAVLEIKNEDIAKYIKEIVA